MKGGKIWRDTYVLVECVRSIVGEEPRRDGSHVGLDGVRHTAQTAQVGLVGLNGTDKVGENRQIEAFGAGETPTEGLEESSGFIRGQLDRPTRVPVVNAVNDIVKVLEGVWIGKEGGNKVNLVVSGELIDELALPAIGRGTRTESTSISGEGRGKYIAVVPQLAGVAGVAGDVVTERSCVVRGGAWHHALSRSS